MNISSDASISGIRAAFKRQDSTGHNVANSLTPGFEQYRVNQTDLSGQGTRIASMTRTPNADPTTSNTDLAQAAVEQIDNKANLGANLSVLKVKNNMTQSLLDIVA